MKKKFLLVFLFSFIHFSFAGTLIETCSKISTIEDTNFCTKFQTIAGCHCRNQVLPSMRYKCGDMAFIIQSMMDIHHSIQTACNRQKDTPPQQCVEYWNCYLQGGANSSGQKCSTTGKKCA